MEETPKALRVAVVEDDPRIQQLISAEITDEGHACISSGPQKTFSTKPALIVSICCCWT